VLAALAMIFVIAITAAFVVVQSGWFHEYVRGRIVAEIERATGGRVELGRFSFRGATLTAQVSPLVLHGKEAPGEPPLLSVESVALRVHVISVLEHKVDLAALRLQKPQVRIVTYPDGSTNLPSPHEHADQRNWAEQLVDLAIRQYEISDGVVEYDDRKIPLNLRGEGLEVRMNYDEQAPSYRVELNSSRVRILSAELAPMEVGVAAGLAVERTRIAFSQLRLSTKESRADLTGEIRNLQEPRGSFDVKANAAVRELVQTFSIPLEPTGSAALDGRLTVALGDTFTFGVNGRINARGIGYVKDRVKVEKADVRGDVHLGSDEVALTSIEASALGAHFAGSASLRHGKDLRVDGTVAGLVVSQVAKLATDRVLPWDGLLTGDVSLSATVGRMDAKARVNMAVSPAADSSPVAGRIRGAFDQATGALSLDSSYLATAATRLDVAGTLDKAIQVQFRSTKLDDILPALALIDQQASEQLPVRLNNGTASASGTVTGKLDDPHFQGQASVTNGIVEGHVFDKFTADVSANRSAVLASRFTLSRGATEVRGNATITARNGSFDDASISGQAMVRNADLQELMKEAGSDIEVIGTANASLRVSGTVNTPQADIVLDVQKPAAFGERLDRVRATLRLASESVDISGGQAEDGPGRLRFAGNYRRTGNDWKAGEAQLQLVAQNLPVMRVETLSHFAPRFDARLNADIRGRGRISNGQFALTSADGSASAQQVTLDRQPLGEIALSGNTNGTTVSVMATGKVRDIPFNGQGSWRLEGDEPGNGNLQFNRMAVESVHKLALLAGAAPSDQGDLPFEGFVEGHATFTLALLRPQDFQGEVTLNAVQLNPKPTQALQLGVQAQDLVVRNSQPVVVAVNMREARIQSAQFVARDTAIEAAGTVPFATGAGADLSLRGSINLIILQLVNPDLLATGNATVQASVRGTLTDPALNGRMELKGASLYLKDFPNGVDNANGVVLFDRNRAAIDNLTASTGGGAISFGGFVGFGQVLVYRLQADVQQVRVRWPQDLSNTFTAKLALNGTSNASTLSGTLTLNRTAINPRADLGQLVAVAGRSSPVNDDENSYLRGLQFNVRIESSPIFEFATALTQDLQAAVDLRLRGTPAQPVLLGTIDVNEGEIQVFGNKYTVDRGEVRFLNPVKIEPTLDVQLETKARGIAVTVSFTGTAQKMNISYSSDPPLQQSEIIALLAVGRDPNALAGLASAQTTDSSSGLATAGGGLLSQALSDQLSNRFQRFFGSSKVKIDPTMTGVDSLPQARLTLEQNVSKDITFTYITDLNRTQEQIVRLEWTFDKNWSAIAVRDANGLFGIDFQYKKRFK
jgi:translocation and assembly module TamB